MMKKLESKRSWNIKGAPFRMGQVVKVVKAADDTCDARWIGAIGRVVHLDYDCGCGQTYPRDPMIGVRFDGGHVEEFWAEELKVFGLKCPRTSKTTCGDWWNGSPA